MFLLKESSTCDYTQPHFDGELSSAESLGSKEINALIFFSYFTSALLSFLFFGGFGRESVIDEAGRAEDKHLFMTANMDQKPMCVLEK